MKSQAAIWCLLWLLSGLKVHPKQLTHIVVRTYNWMIDPLKRLDTKNVITNPPSLLCVLNLCIQCTRSAINAFHIKTVCAALSFSFHIRGGNKLVELHTSQKNMDWTSCNFSREAFVKCPRFPWKIRLKICWHIVRDLEKIKYFLKRQFASLFWSFVPVFVWQLGV